ncbi:tRNA lysidine(34) synthetase TilS [Pectobacterium versatile]|uniref:tRNA lysidine(34) synthetase TilS n=1 Tax=Pectobacterium versatile TaxID=2488639 RepID=UPI000E2EE98A|nr:MULTISPECIES: tRNA lysidine(34) synthetase TilS [Pectobacterium]MBA0162761.1 tRNA lysidine(34) synthetase TilS [Pectobacterium versatile]MBD0846075.1 tRNA(Ile)-lysidine ligase [Pectobacterium carotovorum subsp. carotovorum]MBN3058634.1 tRNA lysidine(34) synthetase TilS [Pectobacterium versatile]ULS45770.1 tRNA lysidine(34) synthetase TilS [Pectobacterium carotovorum]UNE78525.1 tRNA lysidine(34) synthetase TilS [Pectobacterium versatile]
MRSDTVDHTESVDGLLQTIVAQTAGCGSILLAYSGGLDSSVLLHLLVAVRQRSGLPIRAAYIHHGLNPLADSWAEHCCQQCERWQVPFASLPVKVEAQNGGIEAAARTARYQALQAHLQEGEALLTAQHLDDQSETFLLALKRGSGPAGLSAMAAQSMLGHHRLVRPLLGISRLQLEAYAQRHQLGWIEDDSNQDERFDRNFLRRQILPRLTQRWPHFPSAVARSAQLCAEQEQLLDELLEESLQALCQPDGALSIDGLAPLSPVRRSALLRRWLAQQGATMPAREQLQRLWDEVATSRQDAEPVLQLNQMQIRRFRQYLYLLPLMPSLKDRIIPWQSPSCPLSLPDNLGTLSLADNGVAIRAPENGEAVSIRFSTSGTVHIVGRAHGRQIKKLWQELNVPPWWRDRTPLVFYNEQLIAAVGRFVTREGQVRENQPVWHIVWGK